MVNSIQEGRRLIVELIPPILFEGEELIPRIDWERKDAGDDDGIDVDIRSPLLVHVVTTGGSRTHLSSSANGAPPPRREAPCVHGSDTTKGVVLNG
ncbi:hypothetical protein Cni_G26759 [Canna indica]|uniref:Uncharacterized protein n=1 Tax=Canna indica TaxID=4628 RepID=A0AAQ3L4D9_9LILI|nr:hypothetical protein Cni_G26759 [Canna indica]